MKSNCLTTVGPWLSLAFHSLESLQYIFTLVFWLYSALKRMSLTNSPITICYFFVLSAPKVYLQSRGELPTWTITSNNHCPSEVANREHSFTYVREEMTQTPEAKMKPPQPEQTFPLLPSSPESVLLSRLFSLFLHSCCQELPAGFCPGAVPSQVTACASSSKLLRPLHHKHCLK